MASSNPFPRPGEFTFDHENTLRTDISDDVSRTIHSSAAESRGLAFTAEMLRVGHAVSYATLAKEHPARMYVARGCFANGARLGIEAFFRSDLNKEVQHGVLNGFGSTQGSLLDELPHHKRLLDKETHGPAAKNLLIGQGLLEEQYHPETIDLKQTIIESIGKISTAPEAAEYTGLGFGYTTYLLDIGVGNIQNPPKVDINPADWDTIVDVWQQQGTTE